MGPVCGHHSFPDKYHFVHDVFFLHHGQNTGHNTNDTDCEFLSCALEKNDQWESKNAMGV